MATTEVAVRNSNSELSEVQRLGGLLAASGYFSDARDMAQAAVKVLAGRELGIPPVASMMGINIIKGKVAMGGNLIASRIRAHGYDFKHKQFDNHGCVLLFLGKRGDPEFGLGLIGDRPVLGESSFTDADAKTAQISSDMYKKFPRNMFFNRAISNGAKWFTPEVFAGAPVYVPEELGAKVDEQGDYVADPIEAARQVAEAKIAAMKAAKAAGATVTLVEPPMIEAPIEAEFVDAPTIEGKPINEAGCWSDAPPEKTEAEALRADIAAFPPKETKRERATPLNRKRIELLTAFGGLKKKYKAIGKQSSYYAVLGLHGVEHSDEFPDTEEGLAKARTVYSEMRLNVQELEAWVRDHPEPPAAA